MLVPIALSVFALILLLLFNSKTEHDSIVRRVNFMREKYQDQMLLEKSNVSCNSNTLGLKNGKYLFKKCNLIFLKNAFVIISYVKFGKYKLYTNLIFIENDIVLGHGPIKKFNLNSFNKDVHIEFGNPSFTSTLITIKLKQLTSDEKHLIPINQTNSTV